MSLHLQLDPRPPVPHQHVGVDDRRLDVLRQRRRAARAGSSGIRCGIIMWKQASTAWPRLDAVELAVADIADQHPLVRRCARRCRSNRAGCGHSMHRTVEPRIVERREHDVVHGVAGRDAGNERAHQKPRQRRVAVGEMIDVGLAAVRSAGGRQIEPAEAGIAVFADVGRRHRVASQAEEAVGAALEAVGDLLVAAADLDQIVAIARGLEQFELLVDGPAGERIARR